MRRATEMAYRIGGLAITARGGLKCIEEGDYEVEVCAALDEMLDRIRALADDLAAVLIDGNPIHERS